MKHPFQDPKVRWVSANTIIEANTRAIEREYRSSRPKPRNRAMGLRGEEPRLNDRTEARERI